MNPFSDNIIFIDTEFSSLNPYKGEILSIGIVKLNGEELYLELEYDGEVDSWPKENILPTLTGLKVSRQDAVKLINEFVGLNKPYAVAYVNQFDTLYIYKLFGTGNDPFYWLPIDFASLMFAKGYDPEKELDLAKSLGIDTSRFKLHNALDDAKLLREIYLNFFDLRI